MTRDRDGKVHLLLNRCPHRGNQLCMSQRGNTHTFVCAYHSWSFANTGELRNFPYPTGYDGVDKSQLGMAKVARVESYRGFVFASLAADGIALMEHLGAAKEALDRLSRTSPEGEIEITAGFLKHKGAGQLEAHRRQRDGRLSPTVRPLLDLQRREERNWRSLQQRLDGGESLSRSRALRE